jgi:regulator of replication initiation timing
VTGDWAAPPAVTQAIDGIFDLLLQAAGEIEKLGSDLLALGATVETMRTEMAALKAENAELRERLDGLTGFDIEDMGLVVTSSVAPVFCSEPGCDKLATVTLTWADGVVHDLCDDHAGLRGAVGNIW